MAHKIVLFILIITILGFGLAGAQSNTEKSSVFKPDPTYSIQRPSGFLSSLLDPSRFSMSHSYSISLLTAGKQTFNQGFYLNTMNYKFTDQFTLQARIGFLHQPLGGGFGMMNGQNSKVFLQSARFQYKPSDKTSITFDYQVIPSSMAYPYYSRYRSLYRVP